MKVKRSTPILIILLVGLFAADVMAQRGERNLGSPSTGKSVIYGDLIVEDDPASGPKPISYEIVLYVLGSGGSVLARQTVPGNGRYRFNNLADGDYDVAVVVENSEITRVRVQVNAPYYPTDVRQDINLAWKAVHNRSSRPASVSEEDFYKRTPANQKIFDK